jgi:hypothetical protein
MFLTYFVALPFLLWPKCNRLLRLGRPWGAVTLSRWHCPARRSALRTYLGSLEWVSNYRASAGVARAARLCTCICRSVSCGWALNKSTLLKKMTWIGDIWISSIRMGLNLSSIKLPRPWKSSPSRKNPHCSTRNRTQDLMISSQKLWPLNHETAQD